MKTASESNIIRYIILIYGLLYLGFFIMEPLINYDPENLDFQMSKIEMFTIPLVFVLFLIGTIYSWFNEKNAGIILCCWHFSTWVLSMLFWRDAGMVLVLIFPILFLAVLLIRNGYVKSNESYNTSFFKWKISLRALVINYMAIYLLIVFSNIVPKLIGWDLPTKVDDLAVWNYSSFPGLILLFAFLLFIIGFVISWRSELAAGIIFIVWFLTIVFSTFQYPEFANSGPWILFGLTILVQGILYISNYYKFSRTNKS